MKKILAMLLAAILALSLASAFADELTVESNVLRITLTTPPEAAEESGETDEADEAEAPVELEPLDVALTYSCEYSAPFYYGDVILLTASAEAADAVYGWEISLDGGASWQAVPEADGAAMTVELNAGNANALWRATAATETAAGVSGPVGAFGATEYIPDSITITVTSEAEAPYAYGDVIHFHADYFTLSDNPRVVWETSEDGESWTELPDAEGTELTVIVSEATDGVQVRAKLLTDDTVE